MRPIHPGEILKEDFLVPSNMSANALAVALKIPATRIGEIFHGHRSITPDAALRLARNFRGDALSRLNLQQSFDLKIAEREILPRITKEAKPMEQVQSANSEI
ncbi:addiction module HigA family antidote [Collimonas sp. PA-H2]|uniref:HigA family addiction module antitoxin n=1 Tax=Collimonas sp. PA-H2 TaxID=1881062 RepID=UPI000BF3213A|nr:HigA family addiction module antitoxin [Collimonas sp. PA-H2]PFH09713.1 addiction module HigA family antidote [Collimonas sp. PA-H2]